MSFNQVTLLGNLTRDVEFSATKTGSHLCKFSVAVNKKYKTSTGELKEDVSFFDIDCWGKLAEICNQYLKKGSQVLILGELKQDRFVDSEQKNRSKIKIVAEKVQFIGGIEKSENNQNTNDTHDLANDFNEPNFSGEGVPF